MLRITHTVIYVHIVASLDTLLPNASSFMGIPSSGYQGQSYGAPQRFFTPRGEHNYTSHSQIPPKSCSDVFSC